MDTTSGPVTEGSSARHPEQHSGDPEAQDALAAPELVRPRPTSELVAIATQMWRQQLVALAGPSSLTDVELLGEACLDLAGAHPSGLAQLFAGRPTRLSNLYRDPAELPLARRRARLVTLRSREQAERFGVAPTFLAVGIATWRERSDNAAGGDDVAAIARATGLSTGRSAAPAAATTNSSAGVQHSSSNERPQPDDDNLTNAPDAEAPNDVRLVRAPVLLRPVSIRPRGDGESDYELTLEPNAEINPVVARALRGRGALLDPAALARSTFDGAGFHPGRALDRIDALGQAVFDDFHLAHRTVVGTFLHPGQHLVDDLDELTGLEHHEVVAALAGSQQARDLLHVELPEPTVGDVEPNLERGVGDLDPSTRRALDALATGGHLFIDAPIGADTSTLLAAVVAEAAAIGRSVLYVPGHRRAAAALKDKLAALELDGLILDLPPDPAWRGAVSRRLLGAMTTDADPVDVNRIGTVRRELLTVRHELSRTIEALHAPRPRWGVSAYEAIQSLVELTAREPGPATRVRLDENTAQQLDEAFRSDIADGLRQLYELGGLDEGVARSPWYGTVVADRAAADELLVVVERLLDSGLVELGADIETTVEDLGITPPQSVAQWRAQLEVLSGLREILDVFMPVVLERAPDDLVAATASRAWREERGIELSGRERRRLVKHAKDMVRPGQHVADLHGSLVDVQQRREAWADVFPRGGWPRLPRGLAQLEEHLRRIDADLAVFDGSFVSVPGANTGSRTGAGGSAALPFEELADRLAQLRVSSDELHRVRECSALAHELRSAGIGPLIDDLREREVAPGLLASELELAWWSAVFDAIVASDPYLSRVDGARIETLAGRFRALDAEHLRLLVQPVQSAVVNHVHRALTDHGDQADELFAELLDERLLSVRSVATTYRDVVRRLRPVVVATPTLVPQLAPPHRTVDLVVIDAAQHLAVESVLSAMARGRQIVVVGDPRSASGSAVRELSQILTRVSLTGDAGARDPHLTRFLGAHGYDGALSALPLPRTEELITFDVVDGRGMPDRTSGAVEVTQAEVDRVVALAVEAVVRRPDESLAVVASTRVAADLVREGLLTQVRRHPELAPLFDPRRSEPVLVSDLAGVSGVQRDALIYSVAFGRTPHGRVLHRFGDLAGPAGEALLLDTLGVTRHRLTVVSSVRATDLDATRLRSAGSRLLHDLLEMAEGYEQPVRGTDEAPEDEQPNRLVIDLAERLYNSGLTVETTYGLPGEEPIPLVVGHPDLPGEMLVAVLTDDDDYVNEPSVRVRDRQRKARLERLGWTVTQVWSVSLFLDPEAQANRIRHTVLKIASERLESAAAPGAHETMWDAAGRTWLRELLQPSPVDDEVDLDVVQSGEVMTGTHAAVVAEVASVDLTADGAGAGVGEREFSPRSDAGHDERVRLQGPALRPTSAAATERASSAPQTAATPVVSPLPPTGALPVVMPDLFESVTGTSYATDSHARAEPRSARPAVLPGLPISAYSDDELDDLVAWLASSGEERDAAALGDALRAELGVTRRNHRVDTALANAVARWFVR